MHKLKKLNGYKIIRYLFAFIRQDILPNPFESLINETPVYIGGWEIALCSFIINLITGLIMVPITYNIVGLFYEKKSNPIIGSILYMIFYLIHSFLISLLCEAYPNEILMPLIVIIYIIVLFVIWKIKNSASHFIKH